MNDSPSDVNESNIDIYVLSVSETVTSLFTEHLDKKGYRVTLFTDGRYLLETLREGKPNLLICDTTTLDNEGFEVCRQVKADEDLWVIPVLILTKGSAITDLLRILDCNADNFITHPFDLSFCLSVIESMLSIPVERQTADERKTQFKISHNDQIYVVAANRRKLLEFLLSSFEITVNQSSELSGIRPELQILSESAKALEDRINEQSRIIESFHATLQKKEHTITALNHEVGENTLLLAQKSEAIERLLQQCEANKTLLDTIGENLKSAIQEKDDLKSAFQSETGTLRRQITALLHDVDITRTSLEIVQAELEDEKIHNTSLECTLELLTQQKEQAESTLQSLTLEHDQLKSALSEEKTRRSFAEQQILTLEQAKTLGEEELAKKISSLREELHKQAADQVRMKGELKEGTNQRLSLETELHALRMEKTASESSLGVVIKTLKDQLGGLKETYEKTSAALADEESRTASLKDQLAEITAEKEERIGSLSLENEKLASALSEEKTRLFTAEQEIQTVLQAKTEAEQGLNLTIADLNKTIRHHDEESRQLKAALDEEVTRRISAEEQSETIRREKEQSESALASGLHDLKDQLSQLQETYQNTRTALETEVSRTASLKERLAEVVAEKEKAEEMLQTDRDSYKATFLRLKHDLENATAIPSSLEKELIAARSQNKALSDELNLAYQTAAQSSQQVHSLTAELGQVRAELDAEMRLQQAREETLVTDKKTVQNIEQELRILSDERASLNEMLENERRLRLLAEEKVHEGAQKQELLERDLQAVRDERAKKIQDLIQEFELVGDLQKSLEAQVTLLKDEKMEAENTIQALKRELDQARTALAEEWEDHMISVAAAYKERQRLQQARSPAGPEGVEPETSPQESGQKPVLGVLAKDALPAPETVSYPDLHLSPVVQDRSAPQGTSPEIPVIPVAPENEAEGDMQEDVSAPFLVSGDTGNEPVLSEDEQADRDAKGNEPEKEYTAPLPPDFGPPIYHGVFSFSRSQWLDLLKWAHHSGALSHEQRIQIVRMGRLIQKDRKLTKKQEDQVNEMIALVQSLGYRPR